LIHFSNLHRRSARLVGLCAIKEKRICLAESCTGGYLSKIITDVPGSSKAFWGGLIVYSNESKRLFAGVKPETLEKHGAVSAQTVRELVEGMLAATPCDIALDVSGIAGPEGGSPDKPVGTVWFAIGQRGERAHTRREAFSGNRDSIRRKACRASLDYLIALLDKPESFGLDNS